MKSEYDVLSVTFRISRQRVQRLMRLMGLKAIYLQPMARGFLYLVATGPALCAPICQDKVRQKEHDS